MAVAPAKPTDNREQVSYPEKTFSRDRRLAREHERFWRSWHEVIEEKAELFRSLSPMQGADAVAVLIEKVLFAGALEHLEATDPKLFGTLSRVIAEINEEEEWGEPWPPFYSWQAYTYENLQMRLPTATAHALEGVAFWARQTDKLASHWVEASPDLDVEDEHAGAWARVLELTLELLYEYPSVTWEQIRATANPRDRWEARLGAAGYMLTRLSLEQHPDTKKAVQGWTHNTGWGRVGKALGNTWESFPTILATYAEHAMTEAESSVGEPERSFLVDYGELLTLAKHRTESGVRKDGKLLSTRAHSVDIEQVEDPDPRDGWREEVLDATGKLARRILTGQQFEAYLAAKLEEGDVKANATAKSSTARTHVHRAKAKLRAAVRDDPSEDANRLRRLYDERPGARRLPGAEPRASKWEWVGEGRTEEDFSRPVEYGEITRDEAKEVLRRAAAKRPAKELLFKRTFRSVAFR